MASTSSEAKRLGILPEESSSFMYTRNFSSAIWESVNRNTICSKPRVRPHTHTHTHTSVAMQEA
eukprot:1699039-Rhodomonas_salina.2